MRFSNDAHEKKDITVFMKSFNGNNIRDTSFCDAIAINYDQMLLKIFINTIAKPRKKVDRLS